ncbi:HNH domain-containing protein [Sphingomonas antarctica]
MSNTKAWRQKRRTTKPNARQKRNGLFLDAHPFCQGCCCHQAREAHHELPRGHDDRYDWRFMMALCVACHVLRHRALSAS